jgi:hypothetical protein
VNPSLALSTDFSFVLGYQFLRGTRLADDTVRLLLAAVKRPDPLLKVVF